MKLPRVGAYVFDLDGTLAGGAPTYERVLLDISNMTGMPYEELLARYRKQWNGFDEAECFHCMLAEETGADPDEVHLKYQEFRIRKTRPYVLPKARWILEQIRNMGAARVCWTRGDPELQWQTLTWCGFERLFNAVIIVAEKNHETVERELVPALNGNSFYMIGDSFLEDIEPVSGIAEASVWVAGRSEMEPLGGSGQLFRDLVRVESIADAYQLLIP